MVRRRGEQEEQEDEAHYQLCYILQDCELPLDDV